MSSHTVTPEAGDNGSISPSEVQTVVHGEALAFTLTPNDNYIGQISGTCGGSLVDNIYTTNVITADCTVQAGFSLKSYPVTPEAGDNGSISPSEVQTVVHGEALAFTLTPNDNYIGQVSGTCGGSLVDNIYTTNVITADE